MFKALSALSAGRGWLNGASGAVPAAWRAVGTTSGSSAPEAAASVAASTKPVLTKEFQVYRFDPDSPDAKPFYQSYKVDINR